MSLSTLRVSFCLMVLAALTGCGGGSNTGTTGGGNPTIVTYTFNGPVPAAIATQIGTGAYTQATLSGGKLTVSVPQGEEKFSVAYACPPVGTNPAFSEEIVTEASILDGTSYSASCASTSGASQTGLVTLQANAAAIPGAEWVFAGDEGMEWSGSTLNFSEQLPVGTRDIPVTVSNSPSPPFIGNYLAVRILRNQTIPGALNGGNPVVFTASDELPSQPITYANVPSGYLIDSPSVYYFTAGGASLSLDAAGPTSQYLAIPSVAQQSGDYYWFSAFAYNRSGGGVGIEQYTSTGGPQAFTFPAPASFPAPAPAALPAFNLNYAGFSGTGNVVQSASINWSQGGASNESISISATANYQNGSSALSIPDLSALTGFIAPAASGATVYWDANVSQGNPFQTNPPTGNIQYASTGGTYAEP